MKLSVILPCYNVGRFVRLCLHYVQMENVRKSIELIDTRNAPLKYYLPFRMLKLGLYRTLYYLVRCSQVVLGNVSGRKSVFR